MSTKAENLVKTVQYFPRYLAKYVNFCYIIPKIPICYLGCYLRGSWTDLPQICTEYRQTVAIEYFKIITVIFQSVSKCKPTE